MDKTNKIIHKRSAAKLDNGKAKLPTAEQLEYGELAINFAKGVETISFKNNEDEIVEINPSLLSGAITENAQSIEAIKDRVNTIYEAVIENEEIVAEALTDLDDRLKAVESSTITEEDLKDYTPLTEHNKVVLSVEGLNEIVSNVPLVQFEDSTYGIAASSTRTTEDITISGGPLESIAKQVYKDGVLPAGTDMQDFFKNLLCSVQWPSTTSTTGSCSLSLSAPSLQRTPTSTMVTLGTPISFSAVTANAVSVSSVSNPKVTGFTYGYSDGLNGTINTNKSITTTTTYGQKSGSVYKLAATVSGFSGTTPTSGSNATASSCKLSATTLTANLGTNTYKVSETGATYTFSYDGIKSYNIVSNLGGRDSAHTSTAIATVTNKDTNTPTTSVTVTVTGVYPVYSNIVNGAFTTDATQQLSLQTGTTFTFTSVPKETAATPFMFDFPSTKSISSFKIKDPSGNWADFSATYTTDTTVTKTINGKAYTYKRLKTTGNQGAGNTYQIVLNSALNK